jgi:VIT1/CCC1 family predicted Fe2+/Mn2+ transporter
MYHTVDTAYAAWAQTFVNKVWGAIFGGLALIIPMIIMTIHTSVQKSLIVSSLSVLLIALVIAKFSDGSWKDVLGVSAAYAAVLVVFVGTSTDWARNK